MPIRAAAAYATKPPVIRDRMPTLELVDDDIVESKPMRGLDELPMMRRSSPPPAPRAKTIRPPAAPSAVAPAPPAPAAAPAEEPIPPPPASTVRAKTISEPDPTDILFDGMYEMNFVDTAIEAAALCAGSLARALGARAVVIHAHDLATRELRVIGAHGPGAGALLGTSGPSDDDLVGSAVIVNQAPVTMRFEGELPKIAPRRLSTIGAPRSLVAVPAIAWGRCVAVIEVIDADERFASRVSDSAAYVAEHLAEFVSERAAAA